MENEIYYFIIKKNILKSRLQLANAFHNDGTLWYNGQNFLELINNSNIKIRVIIPIEETNAPSDKLLNFYFSFNIKNIALKTNDVTNIMLKYTDNKTLTIIGVTNTTFEKLNIKNIKNSISIPSQNNDIFKNCYSNSLIPATEKEYINQTIELKFKDIFNFNSNFVYNSIDMNKYNNKVGFFIIPYHILISYFNKVSNSKNNKLTFVIKEDKIILSIYNNMTKIINKLYSKYIIINKTIEIDSMFNIELKNLESLKNINISVCDSKKNIKIFSNLMFEIITEGTLVSGLSIKPVSDFQDFFIFIPTI